MNKLATRKAIRDWLKEHKKEHNIDLGSCRISHAMPRVYVIGKAASKCLIVSLPWQDAEPDMQDELRNNNLTIVRLFDESLMAGMFAQYGYAACKFSGERVAIPI